MADGELTLKLDDETARRLQAAADAAGRSVGDYAAGLIAEGLDGDHWQGAREALAEFDRTGESFDAETTMAEFRASVARRVASD
ncbi:MAG: TraY domain-containing protein [Phenylobacterium sp.]|uniref:TraY domain-containing protein n=1 Tax=Phenylobacterium sp. TaxID=1871053 RepID=UPI0027324061|nr:TraY domain-containing protein [Phenylobacterium sp.]MDP3746836.1 TraY domain-containing protein [Phenylobacterium sp.]